MTILGEFGISAQSFKLGEFIQGHDGLTAELERIVPTNAYAIPYGWVTGRAETLDQLTASMEDSEMVDSVTVLDELTVSDSDEQQHLYRIEWVEDELEVVGGIIAADGDVLEGQAPTTTGSSGSGSPTTATSPTSTSTSRTTTFGTSA